MAKQKSDTANNGARPQNLEWAAWEREWHDGRDTGQLEHATGTLLSTEKAAKELTLERQIEEQQIAELVTAPQPIAKPEGAETHTPE